MKRKLLFLAFILISAFANAQYPLLQYLGSDSTIVKSRGGLQGRFAPIPFTDTTSANLSRISQYPGALIYTSGVDKYWYRNATTTGWIEFTSSGGSTVNIYNSNGTLTGERTVDGDGNGLSFNSFRWFAVGADSIQLSLNSDVFRIFGIPETQDTSTYKPLVLDPITGRVLQSSYWYGSGGSGVNIYNSNGTISEDRYVDGGEHRLQFNALQSFQVAADSITFNLVENYLFLTGLVSTQDTSTYKPMVVDPVTGRVLQSSYWYGGTGGSSSGIVSLGTSAYGLITQNDSTYKVDTTLLSTKLWRQKGIDSVQSNVNLKLNITDTANMRVRLYEGSNITITGTYPNLTVASTGGGADTSVLLVDTLYNRLATVINVDSMRLKSVEIKLNGSAVTPTATDSTLSWDILASGGTTGVKSVEIVGDSAYLVNDSNTLTGTKVYGYYNGTKGWKESKKMTFIIPYDGEVVMISGDSLTNGRKVDSIYRTVGKDSIIFTIAGTRYAIKDSTGGGASGLTKGTTTIASSATGRVLYDSSGILQNNSSMTYDGTRLYLPGSSTQSALSAGRIEMQSLGVNNSWFGENVYYSSGWKARATGYTPMFYFPNGQIEIQTVAASVSAGAATTPLTRIKVQTNGRVAMGTNVQSLTAQAHLFLSNGSNTLAPFGIYLPGADVLATPVAGVFEAKVDSIYWTGNDVTRKKIALVTAGSPFLASGTATPTATNGTNVTASTPGQTQYMRVGNTVTVSGYIEITCTTLGVTSQIDLTIPVASAFTNTTQLSGTMLEAVVGVASPGHGTVISEATNDRVQIDFTPRATGSLSYRFTYTYQVL